MPKTKIPAEYISDNPSLSGTDSVKVPAGTQMTKSSDETIDFPNGTILTKTFYYYNDERDTTLGKRDGRRI